MGERDAEAHVSRTRKPKHRMFFLDFAMRHQPKRMKAHSYHFPENRKPPVCSGDAREREAPGPPWKGNPGATRKKTHNAADLGFAHQRLMAWKAPGRLAARWTRSATRRLSALEPSRGRAVGDDALPLTTFGGGTPCVDAVYITSEPACAHHAKDAIRRYVYR